MTNLKHEYLPNGSHRLSFIDTKGEVAEYGEPAFLLGEYMALSPYYGDDEGIYTIKKQSGIDIVQVNN